MTIRVAAALVAVFLGFAVVLMHTGIGPMGGMSHGTAPALASSDHHPTAEKQSLDAVHDHEAHDCAGLVVAHQVVAAPPLVAIVRMSDGASEPSPADRAALARGPPHWTVLQLSQLCVLRV